MSRAYVRMLWSGVRPSHSTSNSRLSQTSYPFKFWRYLEVRMAWKRNRSWTADVLCRLDSDCAFVGDSEQDLVPPEALFPHGGGPSEDGTPFLLRFLVQEIIFAHSLCRACWLCSRGTAATKCAILHSRTRRLHPVQRVRTSQFRGAPLGALVPAGTGAY